MDFENWNFLPFIEMLPKKYRLSRSDFDLIYKKGRRLRGSNFGIAYLPAENNDESCKIGIVISKKVYPKAVDRNRLKRQLRAILIDDVLTTLSSGKKIVLTAFPAPTKNKYKGIKEEILDLFQKIG